MKPLLLLILSSTTLSLALQNDPHPLDSTLTELFSLCDTDASTDLSGAELASCGLSYLSTGLKYYAQDKGSRYSRQEMAKALS